MGGGYAVENTHAMFAKPGPGAGTHWSPIVQPPGSSAGPVDEQARAELAHVTRGSTVVGLGLQVPPDGVRAESTLNEPAEPNAFVATGVHTPSGTVTLTAFPVQSVCWWKVPCGEQVTPVGSHEQPHVACGAAKPIHPSRGIP